MLWYQVESSPGGVEADCFLCVITRAISVMKFGGRREDGMQDEHTVFRVNFIFILIDNVSIL